LIEGYPWVKQKIVFLQPLTLVLTRGKWPKVNPASSKGYPRGEPEGKIRDKQNGSLQLLRWRFVNLFGCLTILIAKFKLQQVFWLSWQ